MNDVDIRLSQEVAEKASVEITDLKKEIEKSKDIKLSILQDVLGDVRDQRKFLKTLCLILCSFVFMSIVGIVIVSISNQRILSDVSDKSIERVLKFVQFENVTIDTSEIPSDSN